MRMRNISTIVAGWLALSLTACSGCKSSATSAGTSLPVVEVAEAKLGSIAYAVQVSGRFQPMHVVKVPARTSGRIDEVFVKIGDRVHQGDLLAILDVPGGEYPRDDQVRNAERRAVQAEAEHTEAHWDLLLLIAKHSQHPGQVSEQTLWKARDKDSATEAKMEAADAAFSAVTGQGIEALEKRIVTAPVDGVVWGYCVPGSRVEAGRAFHDQPFSVVDLVQYDLLRLKVQLPETAVRFLSLRQFIDVRADPVGKIFTGMVIGIDSHPRQKGKTTQAEIVVLNKDFTLTPGMYGNVELPLGQKQEILTIPAQAVRKDGSRYEVLVLDGDNRLQLREVRTGIEGDALVQIVGGLQEGEQVVEDAQSNYRIGEQVFPDVIQTEASEQLRFDGPGYPPMYGPRRYPSATHPRRSRFRVSDREEGGD